ncbi:hypothetical protein HDU76_001738 [Blyttiomyces sp. JEL0837]|nr:hypothetical protein HDU76_001738 [Blyttiomyces sp. JEL0837]
MPVAITAATNVNGQVFNDRISLSSIAVPTTPINSSRSSSSISVPPAPTKASRQGDHPTPSSPHSESVPPSPSSSNDQASDTRNRNQPSFLFDTERLPIRTSLGDDNESQSESEESVLEQSSGDSYIDDSDLTINVGAIKGVLETRQKEMLKEIRQPEKEQDTKPTEMAKRKRWVIKENFMGGKVHLIKKPTASELTNLHLHPAIYSFLQPIADLEALAKLIGAPPDWEAKCERVLADEEVLGRFDALARLEDDCAEILVETAFQSLCSVIDSKLGRRGSFASQKKVIVGGFMALSKYDYKSTTDAYYVDETTGQYLIASEIKTATTFKNDHLWYRKSRSPQLFAALFALGAPTFLLTPKSWKVFVENKERNEIYTLPYGSNTNRDDVKWPHEIAGMDIFLIPVITICLLAPPTRANNNKKLPVRDREKIIPALKDMTWLEQGNINQTPTPYKQQQQDNTSRSSMHSNQQQHTTLSSSPLTRQPRFQTGVDHAGNPVYQVIRVLSPEEVEEVEAEERREMEEAKKVEERPEVEEGKKAGVVELLGGSEKTLDVDVVDE